jgi:hypothetical protein
MANASNSFPDLKQLDHRPFVGHNHLQMPGCYRQKKKPEPTWPLSWCPLSGRGMGVLLVLGVREMYRKGMACAFQAVGQPNRVGARICRRRLKAAAPKKMAQGGVGNTQRLGCGQRFEKMMGH